MSEAPNSQTLLLSAWRLLITGFKNWSLILWRFSLQGFGALGVWGVKSSDFTAAEKESGGFRVKGLGFREGHGLMGKTQVPRDPNTP